MEDLKILRVEITARIGEIFNQIGQPLSDRHIEDLDKLDNQSLVDTYDAICGLQELSIRKKAIHKVLDEINLQNK